MKIRGRRESRVPLAPAVRVQKMHTVDHRYPETPGSPCAMVLRLIPRSPRRRIRLATVVDGLMACPPGWARKNLRQLDTSNGCQDHTALPYAATSAKTLRRTVCDPPDSARGVSTPFVRAPVHRSQAIPALRCRFAPDAAASTASCPASVTFATRPSEWDRTQPIYRRVGVAVKRNFCKSENKWAPWRNGCRTRRGTYIRAST
jgi:hypothetical protein